MVSITKLREIIASEFGVDLPVSGGLGRSLEDAVVMEYVEPNDFVGAEYAYLKFLGIMRGISWQRTQQMLLKIEGRYYDQIDIEIQQEKGDEIITGSESYFFDITECFGK